MSNATKTLFIVFVCLLVLTGLTEWLGGSSASEAFQRNVIALDTVAVQTLIVRDASQSAPIRLVRSAGAWTVAAGEDGTRYPASGAAIERALGTLGTLQARAVVTRQPSKHARFGVDSTGTTVTALDGDGDVLAGLVVGRSSFANRQPNTYVRPPDAPSVFEVEGALSSLTQDVEGWREKRIWTVDRSAITQVAFDYPADSAFTIERAATDGGAAWTSNGDTLRTGAVGALLDRLATLDATGFDENLSPDAFGEALYTLRVHLDSGAQRVIHIRPAEGDEDARYVATASNYPYVFELRRSVWDDRVLMSRTDLLRTTS